MDWLRSTWPTILSASPTCLAGIGSDQRGHIHWRYRECSLRLSATEHSVRPVPDSGTAYPAKSSIVRLLTRSVVGWNFLFQCFFKFTSTLLGRLCTVVTGGLIRPLWWACAMAAIVISEVLFFVFNKYGKVPDDHLKKIINNFYSIGDIRLWRLLFNWRYINIRIHSFIHSSCKRTSACGNGAFIGSGHVRGFGVWACQTRHAWSSSSGYSP